MIELSTREILLLFILSSYVIFDVRCKNNRKQVLLRGSEEYFSKYSEENYKLNSYFRQSIPKSLWVYSFTNFSTLQREELFLSNMEFLKESYRAAFEDSEIALEVMNDKKCINMIDLVPVQGVSKDLLKYYNSSEDSEKRDICRIVTSYLHGGYHLNVELEVIEPFIAPKSISFVSVIGKNNSFVDFIASTPFHPVLYNTLETLISKSKEQQIDSFVANDKNSSSLRVSLEHSYRIITTERQDLKKKSQLLLKSEMKNIFENEYGFIPKQDGDGPLCDYVIVDELTKKLYFYATFVNGNRNCTNQNFLQYSDI